MLFAERNGYALALACSAPWLARSVGFVGFSDGWQELRAHGRLRQLYERAENGNVALTGEIDLSASAEFVLALGFGGTPAAAGQHALASLLRGFDRRESRIPGRLEQRGIVRGRRPPRTDAAHPLVDFSAAVLRVHESKHFRGGVIASLSIPWGFSKGDDDLGGYHLVWPRDLVETAGGFLAAGAHHDARRVLRFLQVTQDADGHWCQNMWLDGSPYWTGIQMDEAALPVLLVDLAARCGALQAWRARAVLADGAARRRLRRAQWSGQPAGSLGRRRGLFAVHARRGDRRADRGRRRCRREWTSGHRDVSPRNRRRLERVARRLDVRHGHVARAARAASTATTSAWRNPIRPTPRRRSTASCRSRTGHRRRARASAALTVSPDALALVRFGLRAADDPRIVNTVKVIDALLKVDTPRGPSWHRYNGDGYGEHDDGSPFDGTGTGRAWPLLTGERGHYELAAGRLGTCRGAGGGDGGVRRRRSVAARTGLGCAGHCRARALHGPGVRIGAAARVGACGVPQAAPVDSTTAACSISRRRPSPAT